MKKIGYYNGEIGELDDIMCPITDRAMYFGDGCYDATYVNNGIAFAIDEHLDRFYNSCRFLRIDFQYTRDELKKILYGLVSMFDNDRQGMMYWQTSRGADVRHHSFPTKEEIKPTLMAYLIERSLTSSDKEFDVISMEDTRYKLCNIKTLNQLPSVMAVQLAKEMGCREVIFHREGKVTEMAHSNISFLKDGKLIYHPFDWKILPGIAVKRLIRIAEENGIPTEEKELSLVEALNADELIITSSGTLCNRVCSCDHISVGKRDDKNFRNLQKLVYDDFKNATENSL